MGKQKIRSGDIRADNSRPKETNRPEGDDGHTIVNMNVEGMQGYRAPSDALEAGVKAPPPSRRETMWMMSGALRAALVVCSVMSLGIIGFVGILLLLIK